MNTLRKVVANFVRSSFSTLSPLQLNEEESLLILLMLSVSDHPVHVIQMHLRLKENREVGLKNDMLLMFLFS